MTVLKQAVRIEAALDRLARREERALEKIRARFRAQRIELLSGVPADVRAHLEAAGHEAPRDVP